MEERSLHRKKERERVSEKAAFSPLYSSSTAKHRLSIRPPLLSLGLKSDRESTLIFRNCTTQEARVASEPFRCLCVPFVANLAPLPPLPANIYALYIWFDIPI